MLFLLSLQIGEFDWDENVQGVVLGSFFYGYVLTQIPGGRLAELLGAKWLLGGGILITSILTLLTPLAARWSPIALVTLRILEGFSEVSAVFFSFLSLLYHSSHVIRDVAICEWLNSCKWLLFPTGLSISR